MLPFELTSYRPPFAVPNARPPPFASTEVTALPSPESDHSTAPVRRLSAYALPSADPAYTRRLMAERPLIAPPVVAVHFTAPVDELYAITLPLEVPTNTSPCGGSYTTGTLIGEPALAVQLVFHEGSAIDHS